MQDDNDWPIVICSHWRFQASKINSFSGAPQPHPIFVGSDLYKRIRQAGEGDLGKIKSVGGGIHEIKIDYGPGYRIYFGIHQDEIILLLLGGSKRTQQADLEKSRAYWAKWMEEQNEK